MVNEEKMAKIRRMLIPPTLEKEEEEGEIYFPEEDELNDNLCEEGENYALDRFKLLQDESKAVKEEDTQPGWFFSHEFGEFGDSLIVVPVASVRFRRFYSPSKNYKNQELVCSSADGVIGKVDPESSYSKRGLITETCKDCPFAQWGKDKTPPLCTEIRGTALYLPDQDAILRYDFKGAGMEAFKRMMRVLRGKGGWGRAAFRLSAERTKGKRGMYYKAKMRALKVDDSEKYWFEEANKLWGEMKERFVK